jgi:hypothetical protein
MNAVKFVSGLVVGAGLLLLAIGPARAEWRYTDDKGKSRTVTLMSDVPSQYRNTAVQVVDRNSVSSRQDEPPRTGTAVIPQTEPPKALPQTVMPGTKWWALPEGSPERAAAKLAAEQLAADLRNRATEAGVPHPSTTGVAATSFSSAANTCRALVNDTGSRGQGVYGAAQFQASESDGTVRVLGTKEAIFAFNKCMTDKGQGVNLKMDPK